MDAASVPTLSDLLTDIDFPATGEDLILAARRSGVDHSTLIALRALASFSFSGRWEVNRAIAQSHALVA